MAKFVSFDRLKRYTQHVKSYVGQQILNAKGEWAKQLNLKVDKVKGKGLSTNDFTTELKNKLNDIEAGAQVNTVTGIKGNAESTYRKGDVNLTPANIGAVASSNGDASNTKVTFTQSTSRVNLTSGDTLKTAFGKLSKWFADLKAVAFSGSYNDLSNKPTTLKNPKSLTIQQNGGNQTEYDGSTALTVNITKAGIGLGNVENKSSATIRGELTSSNVTTALGYTPINSSATELTNQNLDAYMGTDYMGKMYYSGGSNSVTGKPSGVDNFWMWVTRNGVGVFSQILMDNKCQLYIRYHDANSWSAWRQVISSGNNISLLNNDKGYQTLQQVEDKINSIISSEIGQITTFSFQVVEKLPSSGTSNHIYLVPISGTTESDNYYEEYCYINSKWELIGTTKVDLTAYAKKTDIPTVDSALSSSSTNPVQNKVINSALSGKLTKTNTDYNAETICLCTHSKSGTVHTLVKKNSNDSYGTVKFVATADFTYGDTFRFGSASSPTVVTPKTEDGELLNTGAFKKGSVVIAYTGDTTETVNTLFFKGGGGLSDAKLAAADAEPGDVRTGKKFYAGDKEVKTGTLPVHNVSIGSYIDFWTNSPNGQKYIDINKISEGIYESTGAEYSPQVRAPAELFGNAAASQVLAGATFTSQNGAKIPGTMPNQGAKTAALNAGGSYTIPAGYHNGSGKVTANSLASQTDANAAAGNILTGKTAWVKGAKITGTMANRGAPNQTLGIGGSYSLSAGYYSGGKISAKGSFSGSGSGNKNGGETDIHRDENNIVAKGYTVSSASASISGKTVTVNVHAHFRLNNNGNINVPNGDLSSVDYSFSFNIG